MATKNTILVVEDDPLLAMDVCETLKGFGYEVLGSVPSGEEAIPTAIKDKPQLILMDINLKGKLDGVETAENIHKTQQTPIVFLTGLSDETTLQRAKLTGPYGYLIKPYDPAELRSTIEVALHQAVAAGDIKISEQDSDNLISDEAFQGSAAGAGEKEAILKRLDIFSNMSPQSLQLLAASCEMDSFDAGQYLHQEANEAERAFVVLTGRVSITKTNHAGKELVLSLLGPGDCFGLLYLLPGFGDVAAAQTQLDSRVLSISKSNFSKLLKSIPELYPALTNELTRRLTVSYDLAMGLAHSRVETRIIGTLINLISSLAKPTSKSTNNEARIFITRKELADLTGTTPETAIRITKQMERDGILDLTRPGIIKVPDISKLKKLV